MGGALGMSGRRGWRRVFEGLCRFRGMVYVDRSSGIDKLEEYYGIEFCKVK